MPLRIEARATPSSLMAWLSPVLALLATGAMMLVMFATAGLDPFGALWLFLFASVSDLYGLGEMLIKAAPLTLIGIGLAVGFRAGVWNIGAEGQLVVGVIASGWLALQYGASGGIWLLPAMVLTGAAGGIAWAAIPAMLRTRFNANEILTSLMLNYVAALWLSYLVFGPWRDPAGFNFPQSAPLNSTALYPILIEGTRAHAGILLAVVAVPAAWMLLNRSFIGFQLTVTGLSLGAARYAGFSAGRAVWTGMLCGGLAAGLVGVGEIAGPLGQIFPTASPGYGYAAIIVAYLGRLHPVGILLAAMLMSLLYLGGDVAQMTLSLPSSITGLVQGMLLFCLLAADVLITYRIRYIVELPPAAAERV